MRTVWLSLIALVLLPGFGFGAEKQPIEVGEVQWSRDLEGALNRSAQEKKPVLILFQEVPGCQGCQRFGKDVLSHALLVEAIESEFIPVLVYNNRKEDQHLLKRFGEPAWNYQVIRFLDANGKDIIPRKDKVWSIGGMAERMSKALKKAGRPIPGYLEGLAIEYNTSDTATAEFSQKQIQGTPFDQLDLTPWQRTKVNAFARRDRNKALSFLSPRQIQKLKKDG